MDNIEKLRVMLQHWIEHNKGHVDEFVKWRELMKEEDRQVLAGHIDEAIAAMDAVNQKLEATLHEAGGPADGDHHHHHHHH